MIQTRYSSQCTADPPDQHVDRPGHVLPLADEDIEHEAVEDHPHEADDGLEEPGQGEVVPRPRPRPGHRGVADREVGGRGEGGHGGQQQREMARPHGGTADR